MVIPITSFFKKEGIHHCYKKLFWFLVWPCLLFTLLSPINAQEISLNFHHLAKEDGLPTAQDYYFFQDSYGFVWIGTDQGLSRYDGKQVKNFTHTTNDSFSIADNNVSSRCFEDKNGDLWFTTFSALHCYKRSKNQFERYRVPAFTQKDFRLFHFDTKEKLWLSTKEKEKVELYHFDLQKKTFTSQGSIQGNQQSVLLNADGSVGHLFSTQLSEQHGMIMTNWASREKDTIAFKLRQRFSPTNQIWIDGDSLVWTAIYNGLGVYDLRNKSSFVVTQRMPSVESDVSWTHSIVPYDEHRLLVSSEKGLLVFDKRQRQFVQQIPFRPFQSFGMHLREMTTLFLDQSKTLWCSGGNKGIAFTNLQKNKFPQLAPTLGADILRLYKDQTGNLWCSSTNSGVWKFNSQGKAILHTTQLDHLDVPEQKIALPDISIFLEDPSGELWGIVANNFLRWHSGKEQFQFRKEWFFGVATDPSNTINDYLELANGTKLITKGNAIYELTFVNGAPQLSNWQDLRSLETRVIKQLFEDQFGHLLIAADDHRVIVLKVQESNIAPIADLTNIGQCTHFWESDRDSFLLATSKGLFAVDRTNYTADFFLEKNVLDNDQVYQLLSPSGQQKYAWLSTSNGLARLDWEMKSIQRFDLADGLLSKGLKTKATLYDPQTEKIWIGGNNGVNVFQPDQITLIDLQPKVQLTQLLVNDTFLSVEQDLSLLHELELPYQQNTLSFQFAAMDFSNPGANQFYYRMQGIEDEWVPNRNNGFVRYPNLSPGKYRFEVKASNSDGVLNEHVKSLDLYIAPPFWQRWWFYVLATLFVSSLIYGWFQYRLRQALKLEMMRVKISSDLHDDVGGLLSGLAMQTEILELTARPEDKPRLQRIAEMSRNAIYQMRDTVWAIDSRKDKMENLLDRMREHAEETLTSQEILFEFRISKVNLEKKMPTNVRQNVYLIFKEAITNIAKHSNASQVWVDLKNESGQFEMKIHDNGQLQKKNYKTTGQGLDNLKMRAKKINAQLNIIPEDGFPISLQFPTAALFQK